jgi:hypothetical protein
MITVKLKRPVGPVGTTDNQGTFGTLTAESFSAFSGELPWRDNAGSLSCIPVGSYKVVWAKSPRLKRYTYRLLDVPGRSGVLIHSANLMGDVSLGFKSQLLGCIALGERLGRLDNQKALLVSMPAVRSFESLLGGQPFILEIT